MKLQNTKIGTQLKIWFAMLFVCCGILATVSYMQSNERFIRTQTLYEHPLQVRHAVGLLEVDILSLQVATRDLILAGNDTETQAATQQLELSKADASIQFDLLRDLYLGPKTDVDNAYNAYVEWRTSLEETARLAIAGQIEEATLTLQSKGTTELQREKMQTHLQAVNEFAINKADTLYADYITLHKQMNIQFALWMVAICSLSLFVIFILLRNIRKPITILSQATQRLHNGDLSSRSEYAYRNEFGDLSASFNMMADRIQSNRILSDRTANLTEAMLVDAGTGNFFKSLLEVLSANTGSQMAAIYLKSDVNDTFEYYESIGMDGKARDSFSSEQFEGEFGAAIFTREIHHIRNIPDDSRFLFQTVGGTFVPREIITIPILASEKLIAIISLASLHAYEAHAISLIENTMNMMGARIEGILVNRKIASLLTEMEQKNRELDAQTNELTAQKAELSQQNVELETQKNQLFEASRLKTNFLSNMSHELRTPLNSVIALSSVLHRRLNKMIPEEEYSYLEIIERNGKNLLTLINDILDISRIEAGREEVEITTFNMKNLIEEVVNLIQPQATQKNIDILNQAGNLELRLTTDANKCRHILQNLIGNAVKFTEKGNVQIVASVHKKAVNIAIKDTGIGIAEEHLAHIFEEFRQADGSTSRRFGGTGLGLAIARKYANLLGGDISVTSTTGVGSTFTLSLPMLYDEDKRIIDKTSTPDIRPASLRHPDQPMSGNGEKIILLVEDSEPAIIQMKDLMEESGHKMLVARNAGEAYEIIEHTIPNAMILDLMMPGVDGFEVLKSIREKEATSYLPVLILTAKHITKEDLKFLKRNNVHQLIQKGDINRVDLQNAVTAMLYPAKKEVKTPKREVAAIEGKPLILVVEDNLDNLITVQAVLAGKYSVIVAVDGAEGVEMARKYVPHLILMDISLPGMDGIDSFHEIRKMPTLQKVPIIALTASAMTQDRETILSHGFDGYIAKPIIENELFDGIEEVLYGK
jgi:signal transduction histidine kinase/DNA-binding response OmpR family regulator/HAMP domain-containing protein